MRSPTEEGCDEACEKGGEVSDTFNQFVAILKKIKRDEVAKLELRLAEAWVRFPSLKAKQTIVEIVEGTLRLYGDGMVHDTE